MKNLQKQGVQIIEVLWIITFKHPNFLVIFFIVLCLLNGYTMSIFPLQKGLTCKTALKYTNSDKLVLIIG